MEKAGESGRHTVEGAAPKVVLIWMLNKKHSVGTWGSPDAYQWTKGKFPSTVLGLKTLVHSISDSRSGHKGAIAKQSQVMELDHKFLLLTRIEVARSSNH